MNSIGLLAAGDAGGEASNPILPVWNETVTYTHLRAHET